MNSFSHDKNEYICIRSFFMQSREVRMEKEAKTQNEIAKMLGISRSYVSRIETKAIGKLSKEFEK